MYCASSTTKANVFHSASHHIPQILYIVAIAKLLHGKSQLFTIVRLSTFLTVAFTKICGKFRVNFARRYTIYLGYVVNSQWIFRFILQFLNNEKIREFCVNGNAQFPRCTKNNGVCSSVRCCDFLNVFIFEITFMIYDTNHIIFKQTPTK